MRVNSACTELITYSTESVMLILQTYIALSVTRYTRSQNNVLLHDKRDRANLLVTGGQVNRCQIALGAMLDDLTQGIIFCILVVLASVTHSTAVQSHLGAAR